MKQEPPAATAISPVRNRKSHAHAWVDAAVGGNYADYDRACDRFGALPVRPEAQASETDEGRLVTGLLVKRDADQIVLRDVQNKLIAIPADQVEQLVPQRKSLMPELLLRDMTAQQVADLLAYLGSLK